MNSFRELKRKQFPLERTVAPAGSLGAVGVEQTLKAHGITFDDIRSWEGKIKRIALPDTPTAVQNGDVHGMSQVATPGHPTWQQLANDVNIKLLPHTEQARKYLTKRGWFEMPPIPEGTLGASQPIRRSAGDPNCSPPPSSPTMSRRGSSRSETRWQTRIAC